MTRTPELISDAVQKISPVIRSPHGEIACLIDAGGKNRYSHRDATMVLVAYRHGLRAVHPLSGRELRALRLKCEQDPASPFIYTSERGAPFTSAGFHKAGRRRPASPWRTRASSSANNTGAPEGSTPGEQTRIKPQVGGHFDCNRNRSVRRSVRTD